MKNIIKNTLILTAITLVAGVLLGLVYEITKEPIALAKEAAKKEAYQQVMSDADAFEGLELIEEKVLITTLTIRMERRINSIFKRFRY